MTIFLDSAPLSLLAAPARGATPRDIFAWAAACSEAGHRLVLPEIVDYEVRRELLRLQRVASIARLDALRAQMLYLPVTTEALREAARLWAEARQAGRPTAHDENIDVDVILAAQARTSGFDPAESVIATVNLRHISLFFPASPWSNIIA